MGWRTYGRSRVWRPIRELCKAFKAVDITLTAFHLHGAAGTYGACTLKIRREADCACTLKIVRRKSRPETDFLFFCECSFCLAAWEDPRMSLAGPHGCGMPAPALGRWGWASARDSWGLRWGGINTGPILTGLVRNLFPDGRTGALYSDLTPQPNPGRYGPWNYRGIPKPPLSCSPNTVTVSAYLVRKVLPFTTPEGQGQG